MTSIEWLVNVVQSCIAPNYIPKEIIDQAKQMHKQEIIDASNGYTTTELLGVTKGEYYYQETFVSKGSDDRPMERKLLKSGFVDVVPKQETLYTEEQVKEAYYQGAADVHDKCIHRTWRGVETKVDIEVLKKLNAEYIQSLKQPKKY